MRAQGWYRDPYGVHEDRYFSDGHPTKLVRDGLAECYDPPPPGPPERELVVVPPGEPAGAANGRDLLRAGGSATAGAVYDKQKAFWAAVDTVIIWGPVA